MSSAIKNKSSSNTQFVHPLVRVKSEDGLTVSAHRRVIQKTGKVYFAKLGKVISDEFLSSLIEQINKCIPTYLFVAVFDGWSKPLALYKCKLEAVHSVVDDEFVSLIPNHIQPLKPAVKTWFLISSMDRLAKNQVCRITVASSGKEVLSSLRGMTPFFKTVVKGDGELATVHEEIKSASQAKKHEEVFDDLDDFDNYEDISDFLNR